MGFLHDPAGQPFDYGVPRAECHGVRLPAEYDGPVHGQMQIPNVPEAEYIVFEHGPFDYEQENCSVKNKVYAAMKSSDDASTGYSFDDSPGRSLTSFMIRRDTGKRSDRCGRCPSHNGWVFFCSPAGQDSQIKVS